MISWCSNVMISLLAVAAMFMIPGMEDSTAAAKSPIPSPLPRPTMEAARTRTAAAIHRENASTNP